MSVTKQEIRAARVANLSDYLLRFHPSEFKREGHWLRMKSNPSICTKYGLGGYKDYSSNETGNSIDFLIRYMKYDFVTAVNCLAHSSSRSREPPNHRVSFPEKVFDTQVVRGYLRGRGFTENVLDRLIAEGLLYQDIRENIVFCSLAGDFFELRGTRPGKPFHQCGKKATDCFWFFSPGGHPTQAFICESAIDAVSLYLLRFGMGDEAADSAYCGIAGVANQKAIERIQRWLPAVIAVDNDKAGQQCRERNAHLPFLIPRNKDWNEDLLDATHPVCSSCVEGGDEYAAPNKYFSQN